MSLKGLSKEMLFEVHTVAGTLQSYIDDAAAGRPFDIVGYQTAVARWIGLCEQVRSITIEVLGVVDKSAGTPVKPR